MFSSKSVGFHAFSRRFLPFLLVRCPMGNLHFRWQRLCCCGLNEYRGEHRGNKYWWSGKEWLKLENGSKSEEKHAYYCVQHGGSPFCEQVNLRNGYGCPRCDGMEEKD